MFDALLVQTCTIYRPERRTAAPDDALVRPMESGDVLTQVVGSVPCRLDFSFLFKSRENALPEEEVGRNTGVLFLKAGVNIRSNDVIRMVNGGTTNASDVVYDHQFDVEYVDPVVDGVGVHHLEAQVSLRDNPLDIA